VAADATGGHKYSISGTATATSISYWIRSVDTTSSPGNAEIISSRLITLDGVAGESSSGATSVQTVIEGTISVNAAGTLNVRFAQNASTTHGTSSVLAGSVFEIQEIS
jgi:hypothetical protein